MARFLAFLGLPILLFLSPLGVAAADQELPRTIQFGGLRNGRAMVSSDENGYTISVEMIPVHVFDEATNRQINRQILAHAAFRALQQYLSEEPISMSITGSIAGGLETMPEVCRLTVCVPVDGVLIGPLAVNEDQQPPRSVPAASDIDSESATGRPRLFGSGGPALLAPQSALLERKQEYRDLIAQLCDVLQAGVEPLPAASEVEGDPSDASAMLSRTTSALFEALRRDIKRDVMLLSIEKQSLLKELRSQEQCLLSPIRIAVPPSQHPTAGEHP